jgi:hypothetical protein
MKAKFFFHSSLRIFLFCFIGALLCCLPSFLFSSQQKRVDTGAEVFRHFQIDQNSKLVLYRESHQSKRLVRNVLSDSGRVFTKMEKDFGITLNERVTVFLISDLKKHPDLPFLDAEPEWASGSAYPSDYLMVIRTNKLGRYPELDITSVFVHELSHIFLHHALKDSPVYVPTWFNEGIAMLEARKWGMRDSYELASTLIIGTYIPLRDLRGRFPKESYEARRAYVESFSFLTYLAENYGEPLIWLVIARMKEGHGFDESFFMVFGQELRRVEEKWISQVTFWYRWVPVATSSVTLWIGVTLLFILGYVRKKSRAKKTLEQWDEEDGWRS